jgi:hypothetical protein
MLHNQKLGHVHRWYNNVKAVFTTVFRENHKIQKSRNKMLRKISEQKRDELDLNE